MTPHLPDDALAHWFRANLMHWATNNPRPLPWKGERDPYKIWLSEIILQQTRVEQGLPYYQKFVEQYPTVHQLANASEDQLLKLWEGLGYYSRARNLHAAAKYISQHLDGKFPNTFEEISTLKGVGDYTASAIAAFAFGLPQAVLDGNVYRVLARFFGLETPTNTPFAKKQFKALAQALLDPAQPGAHNQAMMDFGATCCTPKQARCSSCPMKTECRAFQTGKVATLPLKQAAMTKKKRSFHYQIFNHRGDVFVKKRNERDIWRGLWEFPHASAPLESAPFGGDAVWAAGPFRQILTHQEVTAFFYEVDLPDDTPLEFFQTLEADGCIRVSRNNLKKNIAFPRVIVCYLESKLLTLKPCKNQVNSRFHLNSSSL